MKFLPRTFACLLLLLPALPHARAADAAAQNPALRVSVTGVSESRRSSSPVSTAGGSITLRLAILRDALPRNVFLRQIVVTRAVDDQDRPVGTSGSLIYSLDHYTGLMPSFRDSGISAGTISASVILTAPPRDAESLKFLEGTVEFFMPSAPIDASASNGSIIRVRNIKSHPGRIEDPILAKHGIVFHFLGNKATADEARALAVNSRGALAVEPDSISAVGYYYSDPSGKLAGYQLLDSRGNPIETSSPTAPGNPGPPMPGSSGILTSRLLSAPLPADAQLLIYVLVPEAIKSVPFRIENIALP